MFVSLSFQKIATFQPDQFYEITIEFLKKKDPNVWLDALAALNVNKAENQKRKRYGNGKIAKFMNVLKERVRL